MLSVPITTKSVRSNPAHGEVFSMQEEFEDTKGVIRIVYRRRTDSTMANRKSTKGQTTIYKTDTKN